MELEHTEAAIEEALADVNQRLSKHTRDDDERQIRQHQDLIATRDRLRLAMKEIEAVKRMLQGEDDWD